MHAADKVRIVENRRQDHLAPVALYLGISFEGVGQIGRLGRDAAVELHEVLQFALQLAVLLAFGRIDLLDARAEIGDILFERFQQQVERFAVRLLEMARLLAQNIVGEVAELHAQQLLGLLPLGFALPDLAFQRLGCRFGFGARFDQRANLGFGPLARHARLPFGRGQPLFRFGGVPFGDLARRSGIGRNRFRPRPRYDGCNATAARRRGNQNQQCLHTKANVRNRMRSGKRSPPKKLKIGIIRIIRHEETRKRLHTAALPRRAGRDLRVRRPPFRPAAQTLPLGNVQINLTLPSLIRIFAKTKLRRRRAAFRNRLRTQLGTVFVPIIRLCNALSPPPCFRPISATSTATRG